MLFELLKYESLKSIDEMYKNKYIYFREKNLKE